MCGAVPGAIRLRQLGQGGGRGRLVQEHHEIASAADTVNPKEVPGCVVGSTVGDRGGSGATHSHLIACSEEEPPPNGS